jgi:hypothetical protein
MQRHVLKVLQEYIQSINKCDSAKQGQAGVESLKTVNSDKQCSWLSQTLIATTCTPPQHAHTAPASLDTTTH